MRYGIEQIQSQCLFNEKEIVRVRHVGTDAINALEELKAAGKQRFAWAAFSVSDQSNAAVEEEIGSRVGDTGKMHACARVQHIWNSAYESTPGRSLGAACVFFQVIGCIFH